MSSNMRVFYLYIVALITLLMFLIGIVFTVYNLAKYIFPNNYAFFENDDVRTTYQADVAVNYTEIDRQNYKRETIKDLIVSGLVIVFGFCLYKYNWNVIEKERKILYDNVKGENG